MIDKSIKLTALDAVRDVVNDCIVKAAPTEQKQYHEMLKGINEMAEMVKHPPMSAVEYLEAKDAMCKSVQNCWTCPLTIQLRDDKCLTLERVMPRMVVKVVEEWWKKNGGKA